MPALTQAVTYITLLFIVCLSATIIIQLLIGVINTRHLLYGRKADGRLYFSPERVQLLLFTIWVALSYLLTVIENRGSGKLPDISYTTLALLSGSNMIYLGGKAYSMLFAKSAKGEK